MPAASRLGVGARSVGDCPAHEKPRERDVEQVAIHQGAARPRQWLLRLAAAGRKLGLQQCRPDRRRQGEPAGRHAVRPQADARNARRHAQGGAAGEQDRHRVQHPRQWRPHLRQPAGEGRAHRGDARHARRHGAPPARAALRHDDQELARARRGRRLHVRDDGQQVRLQRRGAHAADRAVRRRDEAQRRRQGGAAGRTRAGAHARRRARLCAGRPHGVHRRPDVRRRPSDPVGRPDAELDPRLRQDPVLGRRDRGAGARADHRQVRRARAQALSGIHLCGVAQALRRRHEFRAGGARHQLGGVPRLGRFRAAAGQCRDLLPRVRQRHLRARHHRRCSP